ncbi:MAG: glycosyltransferase family 9 protein [Nitrospinota bacterium]
MAKTCEEVIQQLLDRGRKDGTPDTSLIETLFELLVSEEKKIAKSCTSLLFSSLVEPLLDSFRFEGRKTYNQIFSKLINLARTHQDGKKIDQLLTKFGLKTGGDMLKRWSSLASSKGPDLHPEKIKKIFILSRVTIGADVAITSIMVEKSKLLFPNARIVLLGSEKIGELFYDTKRVDIQPVRYKTETFFSRLESWIDLAVKLTSNMDKECIVLDPDSRFTQLGLLPVLPPEVEPKRYFFYESTVKEDPPLSFHASLNAWFDTVFTKSKENFATISLSLESTKKADAFLKKIGQNTPVIVTANFGVGGNELKRISGDFERKLVSLILKFNVVLLLDKGFGPEESARIKKISDSFSRNPRLIPFFAGMGMFSALIRKSSLYIGYDSMGQHVAAACSTPEIVIFRGYHSSLFPVRWAPQGRNTVETILANGKKSSEILASVEKALQGILTNPSGLK